MQGGFQTNVSKLDKKPNIQNVYKTEIETKDMLNQITNKSILDKNKTLKSKNQSADYLIKYLEGMILNYINLCEFKGNNMDELKKFMFDNDGNKKNIVKGGARKEDYETNRYTNDASINRNILHFNNNANWGIINIKFVRSLNVYPRVYTIRIWHTDNSNINSFDLEIDYINNTIGDHCYRIYNDEICNNSWNITEIFKIVIQKLIRYEYNNFNNNEVAYILIYNGNINVTPNDLEQKYQIYKSILSFLILTLTLRNDMNKDIFTTYNNTFLLSGICKYNLLRNMPYNYTNCDKIFAGNNVNLMTYIDSPPFNNVAAYYGDCALNTLICKRNMYIRQLLLTKINHIENNIQSSNNSFYYDKINLLLDNFVIVGDISYPQLIKNYVREYYLFINKIKGFEFQRLKNDVSNLNIILLYNNIVNISNSNDNYANKINAILKCISNSNKYIPYFRHHLYMV